MPFYDVLWRKRHLTIRELRAVYANYYSYVFWAMVISILILLDFHGFAERVSLGVLVVYTISIIAVTFSLYFLVTLAGIKISQRFDRFFLIFPIVGLCVTTIATYVVELGMSGYFGNGMSAEHALEKLPANIILTIVLETLYLTFVIPVALTSVGSNPNIRKSYTGGKGAKCKSITVSGHIFKCADFVWVSSQDHYLNVKTNDDETLIRARMSDLVAQLGCRNGIQPHRSHWVARESVVRMESVEGHKRLKLTDGSFIPIARGRISAVQEWLAS
ncbi:MAG TPA: LytTR family transcriptional regulator [Rhodobacteraceae bacterium]|nr:LytTR family transcriptional regulator [Paracoccaceae bacterium]